MAELLPHRLYHPSPLIVVHIRNGIEGAVFLTVAPLLAAEGDDGGWWCAGFCDKVN